LEGEERREKGNAKALHLIKGGEKLKRKTMQEGRLSKEVNTYHHPNLD